MFYIRQVGLRILDLCRQRSDLILRRRQRKLHLLSQRGSMVHELLLALQRRRQRLLASLFLLAVLFADLRAAVRALGAADAGEFVGAVAADVVVAAAVVDGLEANVGWDMAFVFAVEAGKCEGAVVGWRGWSGGARVVLRWGEMGEVAAGGGAGLVRAIWTVAVVVVDAREGDADAGVGDAGKGLLRGGLEEFRDWRDVVSM